MSLKSGEVQCRAATERGTGELSWATDPFAQFGVAPQALMNPLEVIASNQPNPLRKCCKCQECKPDSGFHHNSRLTGGFERTCKTCRAVRDRLRRLGKQQQTCTVTDKECRLCRQIKQADCFQRSALGTGRLHSYCKDCKRVADAAARHRNIRKHLDTGCKNINPQSQQHTCQYCNICIRQPACSGRQPDMSASCHHCALVSPPHAQVCLLQLVDSLPNCKTQDCSCMLLLQSTFLTAYNIDPATASGGNTLLKHTTWTGNHS